MDTIKIKKRLDEIPIDFINQNTEVQWQGLQWDRKAKFKYQTSIKNLRVTLYYKELSIENSLHKFYHGNNYSIYTYKQMCESIKQLDEYFDFSIYDAEIVKYTPGLVVEATPENSYHTWIDYKAKEMLPMLDSKKGKVYGSFFTTGLIKVKGYNKTYETNKRLPRAERLEESLFRLEAEIYAKYAAKTYGIPIHNLADLMDYNNYCKTLDVLLTLYDRIKKNLLDYAKLSCDQYRIIGLFYNKIVYDNYKLYHTHSCKKDRAKFNSIMKNKSYQKKDEVREEILNMMHTMKTY